MAVIGLARVDPEIASATFRAHLDELWATDRVQRLGWKRSDLDDLHILVTMPAQRRGGGVDEYYLRIGAEYYDLGPPVVNFVLPDGATLARAGTKYFPKIEPPNWFGLHDSYAYPDGRDSSQLVCFSFSADFYLTDHSPQASEMWKQGTHRVAATLSRIAEILSPAHYIQPSA